MNSLRKIAFIGNSLPRRCGIATFTTDLQQAVADAFPAVETAIVAMTDHGKTYDYPPQVRYEIRDDHVEDYLATADALNKGGFDLVCLQHEFGIFGGDAGSHILLLMARLKMPIVTTLHTVLAAPDPQQRSVLLQIIRASRKIIVMAEKGRQLLRDVYGAPSAKIEVVAHGIPDFDFLEPEPAKLELGFEGRSVILTFGLLSPNKGIEVILDAMPMILKSQPDAVYVVLGATHPHLVQRQGEAYRENLMARARSLGVENHVVFRDQFVDLATLLQFISMSDVYVTPYLDEAQMTSGTLAYSFGLGKAVVSTPYWHARELLAGGRGVIVPFGDAAAAAREIAGLLTDAPRRDAMRRRAYAESRAMTWPNTAERYLKVFDAARRQSSLSDGILKGGKLLSPAKAPSYPERPKTDYLLAMCDDTGLFQHAVYSVPDRDHGYCVDDNARALILATAFNGPGEHPLPDHLTSRFASFVQHAWNPDDKRFRNFMSFDRRWLESIGSEDSHARTLWSLGECARGDRDPSRRDWASALFAAALPTTEAFQSPRAWAFTLLGLVGYCANGATGAAAYRTRTLLSDRLMQLVTSVETENWIWFEEGLSYDNARLPQALLLTGFATGNTALIQTGLKTLRWLVKVQTAPQGHFRPVGTDGFHDRRQLPELFDQQPLEATATISACLAAWQVDRSPEWLKHASKAFAWFHGDNDLSLPLVDIESGSCRDGLHRTRANENRGAESVLSYLLAALDLRKLQQMQGHPQLFAERPALSA